MNAVAFKVKTSHYTLYKDMLNSLQNTRKPQEGKKKKYIYIHTHIQYIYNKDIKKLQLEEAKLIRLPQLMKETPLQQSLILDHFQ